MELDEDIINEMRESLKNAEGIVYAYLDKEFGSYKKAPDDHPLLKAVQSINDAAFHLSTEEEDDEEEEEDREEA
jgi:hypothetical protein